MKIAIICATGLEECEALVPCDLLRRSGLDVQLIGLQKEIVSSHNVKFICDYTISEVNLNEYDCLMLPGGMPGTLNLENSKEVQDAIDSFIANNKLIAAICAAPSILIHKGLLKDKEFTCYPGYETPLVRLDVKAFKKDNIITGNGLGGAVEFARLIISELKDSTTADTVIKKIQY